MNLCNASDIPLNGSRGFQLPGASVFVVRNDDGIFVYRNACPHLGVELEWLEHQFLDAEGHYIQCATHGALFTIRAGECITGPCLGERLEPIPFRLDGDQLVLLEDARASAPVSDRAGEEG